MVHSGDTGITYIWEKFQDSMMDEDARKFIHEWNKILSALNHRPFHRETQEYRDFVAGTIRKLESLKDRVNVAEEIEKLRQTL
jgi:hypothetical protein